MEDTAKPDPWTPLRRTNPETRPKYRVPRLRRESTDAIGYVRVSTRGQASEGVSLDAQRLAIEAECQRRGLRLVTVHADEGVSGRKASRPGLAQAIADAKRLKASLVVYSLSRFARSAKDALALISELDRAGCAFVSTSETIRTSDACGRMVLGMLAVVAQFEAEIGAERTTDALAHLRASGRKTGGDAPYGCIAGPDGVLRPEPYEAQVIESMLAMRERGQSLRSIVETLNANAIPARRGKAWHLTQVKRIIDREACECA